MELSILSILPFLLMTGSGKNSVALGLCFRVDALAGLFVQCFLQTAE